jgi:hypothetical protein
VAARAMKVTSHPGHGPPQRRAAARITRLQRFRRTAPPMRLPATKSTRPSEPRASGVRLAMSVTVPPLTLMPCLNMLSISCVFVIVRMGRPFDPKNRGATQRSGRAPCGPCGDVRRESHGRHVSTYAYGSRASSRASGCSAGMYASLLVLPFGAPGLTRAQAWRLYSRAVAGVNPPALLRPIIRAALLWVLLHTAGSTVPFLRRKIHRNLWIVWKTLEPSTPGLWITPTVALWKVLRLC